MKCPYCEKEMVRGYIQSSRDIFWSDRKHKSFYTADKDKGEVEIAAATLMSGAVTDAYICNDCKKVIIGFI